MAVVACCWELGGGFGHVTGLLQWARALRSRGHRIIFFVKNMFPSAVILRQEGFECLPGITLPALSRPFRTTTYSQMLLLNGFDDVDNLASGIASWATIYRTFSPALVICHHAPVAALAAQALDISCVLTGNSFFVPPTLTCSQSLVEGDVRQAATDLETLRRTLEEAGKKSGVPDRIFSQDDPLSGCWQVLQSFPELDLYTRKNGTFVGNGTGLVSSLLPPAWPMPTSSWPKVFAYIGGPPHAVERFLSIIPRTEAQFIAFVRTENGHAVPLPRFSNAVFLSNLVNLTAAVAEADIVVNHGSHDTFCTCIRAGKPLVLLPNYQEQVCNSRKVEELGTAKIVLPSGSSKQVRDTLEEALQNRASLCLEAEAFAARHPEAESLQAFEYATDKVDALLR